MNLQRWGIRRIVLLGLLLGLMAVAVLQVFVAHRQLISYLYQLPQTLFLDTASYLADRLVVRTERSGSLSEELRQLTTETARIIPDIRTARVAPDGRILQLEGGCTPTTEHILGISQLAGPIRPDSVEISPPCREDLQLLSGSYFTAPERQALLVFAPPFLVDEARSARGWVHFIFSSVGLALLLYIAAVVAVRLLQHTLIRDAAALARRARRFAEGERDARLGAAETKEFSELASVFNMMAAEQSERLERIEEDDRERQRMMANIIHDLKTPMTAIEGCIELLKHPGRSAEQRAHYLRLIEASARSELELAENLTQLARLTAATVALEPLTEIELGRFCADLCAQLQPAAEKSGIALSFAAEDAELTVLGNSALLTRAIMNLLSNGLRYTNRGGSVAVSVRREGELRQVIVRDTGVGIHADDLPHLFEEFFRGRPLTPADVGGTGLGLSIVDRIARLHGGEIRVESAVGIGSSFTVSLPERPPHDAAAPEKPAPARIEPAIPFETPAPFGALSISSDFACIITGFLSVVLALSPASRLLGAMLTLLPLLRSYGDRSQFVRRALSFASIVAVTVIEFNEPKGALSMALGITIAVQTTAAMGYETKPKAAGLWMLLATVLYYYVYFVTNDALGLAGVVCGIGLMVPALLVDRAPYSRAVAWKLSGFVGFFAIFGAMFQAGAVLLCATTAFNAALDSQARAVASAIAATLESTGPSLRRADELLTYANLINPMFGYSIVDAEGRMILSGTEHGVPGRDGPEDLISSDEVCFGSRCRRIALTVPSAQADRWLRRVFQIPALRFVVWLSVSSSLIMACLTIALQRIVRRRFAVLQSGLERYRNQDYSKPIELDSDDELGELVRVLNHLGRQLPELTAEVERRNEARRVFFQRCGSAISQSAQTMLSLTGVHDAPLEDIAQTLERRIRRQRELLEGLLALSKLEMNAVKAEPELLPIDELLFEEVEALRAQAEERRVKIAASIDAEAVSAIIDPGKFLGAVRYLLRQLLGSTAAGSELAVELSERDRNLVLTITAGGGEGGIAPESDDPEQLTESFLPILHERQLALMSATLERGEAAGRRYARIIVPRAE